MIWERFLKYNNWKETASKLTWWTRYWCFLDGSVVKNTLLMQEMWIGSLGQEDPLEKKMATCSIILVWEIPWTAEPAVLQSMGPRVFGHDLVTETIRLDIDLPHFRSSWRRAWWPTPVLLPGESQGQRNLVGYSPWVARSWTQLKWLSTHVFMSMS